MSRFLMIIILGGFISYGILSIPQNNIVNQSTNNTVKIYSKVQSRNIANSMSEMLLSKVSDSTSWRANSYTETNIFGGIARYKVIDTTLAPKDTVIKICVTGIYNNYPVNVTVYADKQSPGFVPPVVRGVWTANGPLNKTISDMYIDGEDHDLNWNNLPHTGVFGVSTSINFVNTENAAIGGTRDSVDYPMSFPQNPNVIEQNYNWGGHFPNTPDAALGLPDGKLKEIAMSGQNGSQYVTDVKYLTLPLSGVTYIELPEGKQEHLDLTYNVKKGNGGPDPSAYNSRGILVIHNSNGTTQINQTKTGTGQWFEGIIIGDYMFHFHCDVLGAIILLSPNLETSHECNGNKDHRVFYSSLSIRNATKIVGKSSYSNSNNNYGFGAHRLNVRYWLE